MDNEQTIWTFLLSMIGNPYGAAAVMGSFFIESKLNPMLLESSYAKKFGLTSQEYTLKVDSGEITADSFAHDHAGYGLAQWTYWSRKEALLNYAKSMNASISNLNIQLQFFWNEVQSYKTALNALKTATNIRAASDVFTKRYEKPYDISETALKRRADKAQEYYDEYAVLSELKKNYVRIKSNKVNVRTSPVKGNNVAFRTDKDSTFEYFGTNDNGWNGIVLWVHPDYSEVIEK